MEDRLDLERDERRGAALIALAAILTITVAWWALALWPAGAVEPEWLTRTRAACFGAARGGLPDAGGWILLVGEPLGMLAMLAVVWGRSLRRDLAWLGTHRLLRAAAVSAAMLALAGVASMVVRVARVWAAGNAIPIVTDGSAQRVDRAAPLVALVDQHGRSTSWAEFRGRTVLLTFAYGHCSTVCPSIVNDLRMARRAANRPGVPLVIITVDPWRDTPDRLPMLAEHWGLEPGDRVLSGSVDDVQRVLDLFQIARGRDLTTGDIDHANVAMILDDRGRIAWRMTGGARDAANLLRQEWR